MEFKVSRTVTSHVPDDVSVHCWEMYSIQARDVTAFIKERVEAEASLVMPTFPSVLLSYKVTRPRSLASSLGKQHVASRARATIHSQQHLRDADTIRYSMTVLFPLKCPRNFFVLKDLQFRLRHKNRETSAKV